MTMDEQYIRTHDVIGRYLLDQLSERERRAFEVYYFEHPAMLKELELERALRGAAQSLGLIEAVASRESRAPRLLALLTTPAWSIAATVAAVGFGVLLFSFRGGTRAVSYTHLTLPTSDLV